MPEVEKVEETSKVGRFFTKYATLLSSTVLGVAGIAATSMWQCRQSALGEQQAESQQHVAATQADNNWKIERADILSKNIGTLSATGPQSAEQRYGVLLSLTRGNLIDPELAVSYALELGKDNAEYMQSVLANVQTKDYARLARAFTVSCDARYGISPAIEACTDKLAARSTAIAQMIADDGEATFPGPLALLHDERPVQQHISRMVALFTPLLNGLYEERKWDAIDKFMSYAPAAHLVAALVLTAAHTGEFVTDDEAKQLEKFDTTHSQWLATYLMSPTCDSECRSRALSVMVSRFAEADGSYDLATRTILAAPKAQSGQAVSFLHQRLLWCQVDPGDLAALRDRVLAPMATKLVADPKADPAVRDALLGLVLLLPDPALDDFLGIANWDVLTATISRAGEAMTKQFTERRTVATRQRKEPPAKMKNLNFCSAPAGEGQPEPEPAT